MGCGVVGWAAMLRPPPGVWWIPSGLSGTGCIVPSTRRGGGALVRVVRDQLTLNRRHEFAEPSHAFTQVLVRAGEADPHRAAGDMAERAARRYRHTALFEQPHRERVGIQV